MPVSAPAFTQFSVLRSQFSELSGSELGTEDTRLALLSRFPMPLS